jgi:hypothetical protein
MMAGGAAAGLMTSIVDDVWKGSGLDGTGGALLVIVSSALILAASVLLVVARPLPRPFGIVIGTLLLFGIAGTGFAGYMLESDVLAGFMAFALIGWCVHLAPGTRPAARDVPRAAGAIG